MLLSKNKRENKNVQELLKISFVFILGCPFIAMQKKKSVT